MSGIDSQMPWVGGPVPIVGEGWVQLGPDTQKIYWDSLSTSEQEQIIQYLLSAQNPVLAPPAPVLQQSGNSNGSVSSVGTATAANFSASIASSQNEIITAMLDGWIKSIQENAERSKREDERRAIEGLSIAYSVYRHEVDLKTDPNFPMLAVGMIIVGTGIVQSMMPVINTSGIEFNPVVDMYNKVMNPILGDMRAELGLIGAFYASGIQYFTIAQMASEGTGKGKTNPVEFAKGFAENVVRLVSDPSFNNYLMAIVTQGTAPGESLSEERLKELTAMVKLVLLSSALAMLYKVEAGKMTSLEFAGMLNGEISFVQGDIRATLIGLIKGQLALLSPNIKARLLSSLFDYFDSDPAIESLGDPAKVFAGIYGTLPRGDLEA